MASLVVCERHRELIGRMPQRRQMAERGAKRHPCDGRVHGDTRRRASASQRDRHGDAHETGEVFLVVGGEPVVPDARELRLETPRVDERAVGIALERQCADEALASRGGVSRGQW